MRRATGSLRSWPLAILIISSTSPLLCSALEFTLEPWGTDRPIPGTVVFFNVQRSSGDPQLVDVLLMDNTRGNSSVLFTKHDLAQYSYAGFELPAGIPAGSGYVVRMSDATTTPSSPLKDSAAFQIYPAGTQPSVTSTSSTMSGTVLSLTAALSTGSSDSTSSSTEKSPLPVGAIAGGVVGGVALIALFILLLWCIRRQDRPITMDEVERKRQRKQKKLKETEVISPFTLTEPPPHSPNTYPPSSPEVSTSPSSPSNGQQPGRQRSNSNRMDARAEKARLAQNMRTRDLFSPGGIERLPTELTANSTIGDPSSDEAYTSSSALITTEGSTSSPSKSSRKKGSSKSRLKTHRRNMSDAEKAEGLRKEREKLDRQIAELERRASVGGSRNTTRRRQTSEDDEMLAQLTALREQMQLIDRGRTSVPQEPPPEYYPASIAGSRR